MTLTTDDRNLFSSKKFFWFGTDAVEVKGISAFKADKSPEVAHAIAAWAAETGKGLLFFTEKSEDKSVPHGAVLLVRQPYLYRLHNLDS